jgi:hypothetical protein
MHEANGARDAVVGAVPVAENSSLLGAVLSRRLLFCWQSGQGDIALIGERGSRLPFETDARPARRMLLHWQPADALGTRRLVLLSTDGLALGLADRSAYRAFAEELYARMARREAQIVRDGLDHRLRALAERSGEDTSLVAAYAGP